MNFVAALCLHCSYDKMPTAVWCAAALILLRYRASRASDKVAA